jgi:hypothetical protein
MPDSTWCSSHPFGGLGAGLIKAQNHPSVRCFTLLRMTAGVSPCYRWDAYTVTPSSFLAYCPSQAPR